MDLPALQTIPFLQGNRLGRLLASPCWHRNGFSRTDSVLAYGHVTGMLGQAIFAQYSGKLGQRD